MPSQQQILTFRTNPHLFMGKNSIKWRGVAPRDQGIIDVTMVDAGNDARIRTGSKFMGLGNAKADAPKFELRLTNGGNVPQGSPSFEVYWSGYKAGQGCDADLPADDGPDIMLTPEFSGCTAVCRSNSDGSGQFSHYNLMDVDGKSTLDSESMNAIAQAAYGGGHSTMTKEVQRSYGKHTTAVCSTVVGIRRNGRWEFWAQHREIKNGKEQIRAVVRL